MGSLSAILTYHSLDESGSAISITPRMFREQIEFLLASGIPVVPLEKIASAPGAVALTFDDGFGNFYEHALPVLAAHRLPATVFVVSGYAGRKNDWPSQPRSGFPVLPLMSWGALADLAKAGITIGAHTVTHPRLTRLGEDEAIRELEDSRDEIASRLGRAPALFAYPYGDCDARVRGLAAERFALACGTALDYLSGGDGAHALPRLDMFYFRDLARFRRILSSAGYVAVRRGLRRLRSAGRAGS